MRFFVDLSMCVREATSVGVELLPGGSFPDLSFREVPSICYGVSFPYYGGCGQTGGSERTHNPLDVSLVLRPLMALRNFKTDV